MGKQAISVALETDNVTWLEGRAAAAGARSVSELLDRLVSAARRSGGLGVSRSVRGTIDIDVSKPALNDADRNVRIAFERSLRRRG